jgi:hypothetical protein
MGTEPAKPISGAHKFVNGPGIGGANYNGAIFCEYCGHVAFYGNNGDHNIARQEQAKEPCPRNPRKAL